MAVVSAGFESDCQALLDRFYKAHPDDAMQKRARQALRFLRTSEKPLKGKPEGWAAGILYAVANDARIPIGIPGALNTEFKALMGVKMRPVCERAARVRELMTF